MKKIIVAFAIAFLPVLAFANQIQVYPTIHNRHGGTATADEMTACVSIDGVQHCGTGVPAVNAPIGTVYEVSIQPAPGYSYTTSGECSGQVLGDQASIICFVDYSDGAKTANQASQSVYAPATAPSDQALQSGFENIASTTSSDDQMKTLLQIIDLLKQIIALKLQILDLLKGVK